MGSALPLINSIISQKGNFGRLSSIDRYFRLCGWTLLQQTYGLRVLSRKKKQKKKDLHCSRKAQGGVKQIVRCAAGI